MSHKTYTSPLGTLVLALISLALVACGGAGSSTNSTGNGSVGIVLTDGPTADFAEVNVTITEISLIPDDDSDNDIDNDNGPVVIFQGEETINLLRLTDFSALFALSNAVPAGEYEKIRLQLKQPNGIELVKRDAQGNITETVYPAMTGNGKLDLNPRGDFHVVANQTLYIQLDIDADKSLHIVQTGNGGYRFRPVIFVDIIDQQFSGKLVRHFGYVQSLDAANNRFKLCDQPMADMPTTTALSLVTQSIDGCIEVVADDVSVFDQNGDPADRSGIQDDDMLTVIGFVRSYEEHDDDDEETGSTNSTDADSTDADSTDADDHTIRLYAEVIEMGDRDTFAIVDGSVTTEPQTAAAAFGLALDETTDIQVQLQAQAGTRVFSRSGQRLDYRGIDLGLTASVDGVYSATDSSLLKAGLVIVDSAKIDSLQKLSGTVLSVDADSRLITISSDSGDKLIRLTDDSHIFLMLGDGAGALSTVIDILAVPVGAELDVYGHAATDGYFDANTVIVESPDTTP
ncbi:MAG: DUF4382 domain-containing protein [Gammaproteobacteria bacterium]|nr:DUF4382 domain-containing protein [Gammaproteobacteria bacterium]